jgi:dihydrofolate reductase
MISGHVFIATSLDGYIAKPNGDIEWLIARDDPSEDHGYNDFIKDKDGIIMGRGTFEKALTFNPWPYKIPIAVMSKTFNSLNIPEKLKARVRIFNDSPSNVMKILEIEGWRKVYIDGGLVIQSFLREKLVSDMVITTVPVLLGSGRALFGSLTEDVSLTHLKTCAYSSGLVQSTYSVKK